jgi:transcriptional regulator GlxA family with amidase domain
LVSGVELARLSNVSQRALQEGFRRFVGMSIVAYQRQVRLERAFEALRHSASVTEVALRFGFSNVGRFCQYFQQAYGVSPAQLRGRVDWFIGKVLVGQLTVMLADMTPSRAGSLHRVRR